MRFLTAMVTLGHGQFRLYGEPRMHERPIDDLLSALRSLGADVRCDEATRCPPVAISATGLEGGTTTVRSDISSQFLSGLLMAAPFARRKVVVRVAGALVSEPYVEMTMSVMARFGVTVDRESDPFAYCVAGGQRYVAQDYPIEPDATAASYFFAAAAITRGSVTVEGLSRSSIQGDIAFCELLERMGCAVHYGTDEITVIGGPLSGIHADMNKISDTVQTLAAVALFAAGPTTITGVGHIRHKETDRIGNLAKELEKLGASVEEHADGMTITSSSLHGSTVETYNDHRMAMSLSLVGLRVAGVVIRDPNCTRKTYPGFFHDLAQLTAGARD
jgi:3-phosphoshikimate 1-carboxyvinyltransferase